MKKEHPSYGMVQFSRVSFGSGKRNFFGSSVKNHLSGVELTISKGSVANRYGRDYFHSEGLVTSVMLTTAQFAELLTTLNMGPGVPCTLTWTQEDGRIPPPPDDEEVEVERTKEYFAARVRETMEEFEKKAGEIDKILDKKSIGKGDREVVRGLIRKLKMEYEENMPFALEQFEKATDKVTQVAKAEVDAFVSHAAAVTGIKELKRLAEKENDEVNLLEAEK